MKKIKKILNSKRIKFNRKTKRTYIDNFHISLGTDKSLISCIEEISELLEVISVKSIKNVDKLHLAEELADVIFTLKLLQNIYNIKKSELDEVKREVKNNEKKKTVRKAIAKLAKSLKILSKLLRDKTDSKKKILQLVNYVNSSITKIICVFEINMTDIRKIEGHKYRRLNNRFNKGTLK